MREAKYSRYQSLNKHTNISYVIKAVSNITINVVTLIMVLWWYCTHLSDTGTCSLGYPPPGTHHRWDMARGHMGYTCSHSSALYSQHGTCICTETTTLSIKIILHMYVYVYVCMCVCVCVCVCVSGIKPKMCEILTMPLPKTQVFRVLDRLYCSSKHWQLLAQQSSTPSKPESMTCAPPRKHSF